jgi:hypothetical protein
MANMAAFAFSFCFTVCGPIKFPEPQSERASDERAGAAVPEFRIQNSKHCSAAGGREINSDVTG